MRRAKDYTGQRFGRLVVIEPVEGVGAKWVCRCDCGGQKIIQSSHLNARIGLHCGCSNPKIKDLHGRVFGKLKVLSRHSSTRNGHARWLCLCECGAQVTVLSTHLIQGNTKSCGCAKPVFGNRVWKKGSDHPQWKGCGEITGQFWSGIVRGADGSKRRRKIPMTITIDDAWDLFLRQNRKCALTGLLLLLPTRLVDRRGNASLDRIDSSKGYVHGNVQWVHKDINKMKNTLSQSRFVEMCCLVAQCSAGESCEMVDLTRPTE